MLLSREPFDGILVVSVIGRAYAVPAVVWVTKATFSVNDLDNSARETYLGGALLLATSGVSWSDCYPGQEQA
jgi:hypothetical protein